MPQYDFWFSKNVNLDTPPLQAWIVSIFAMPISCFLTKEEEEEEKIHIVQSKTRAVYTTSHPVNGNPPPPTCWHRSWLYCHNWRVHATTTHTHTDKMYFISRPLVTLVGHTITIQENDPINNSNLFSFFFFFPLTTTAKLSIFFLRGEKKKKKNSLTHQRSPRGLWFLAPYI